MFLGCIILITIIFFILKIPFLSLPYFWDEAWSYIPAVEWMRVHGPGILPGAIPPELSRGHPLLFYFLASSWQSILVNSVTVTHILPVIIACAFMLALFLFIKRFFDEYIALNTVLLFASMQIFFVQSGLLLPEILMALWAILVLYSFLTDRKLLYFILASMMMLTKESGFVLIAAIFAVKSATLLLDKEQRSLKRILFQLTFILSPLIAPFVFFIMQKFRFGWIFFPEHMNKISFNPDNIYLTLSIILKIIFFNDGRWFMRVIMISSMIYILIRLRFVIRERIFIKKEMVPLLYILVFILFYIAFCIINFFTDRYLLAILPLIVFLCVFIFIKLLPNKYLHIPVFAFLLVLSLCSYFRSTGIQDINMNYTDAVKVQKATVYYLEANNYREKKIWVSYLMSFNLKDKSLAYLSRGKEFKNLTSVLEDKADAYVTLSFDNDTTTFNPFKRENKLKLIKTFEKGLAKSEIYIP